MQKLKGSGLDEGSLAAFEGRIDGMALVASDLFVRCREQISEIKARSARRQAFVAERLAEKSAGRNHE